jgi:CheY-like chemotaxis protein
MTEPAMLVLDDVPEELEELRGALRRYGLQYVVICESSTAAASDRLTRLAADARPVAIVCAPAAMIETGGGEFLAMAHQLYPAAKPLFVLIGAEPHTDWLPAGIQQDRRGFLLTGSDLRRDIPPDGWPLQRPTASARNEHAGRVCGRGRPSAFGQACRISGR